jgi:hypothetical protein
MRALLFASLIACSTPPIVRSPSAPPTAPTALHTSIALDTLVNLPPASYGRLRLDADGHPYLISRSTIVPLQRLASGDPAKPFRITGATLIDDLAWTSDGVMVFVVGQQLGVVGDAGFAPIVTLPTPHMRVVTASADTMWLFGPDGHLYTYAEDGTLTEVLHVPAAIADVSGSLDRTYVAIGGSIVRLTNRTTTELVFDAADPITALAAIPNGVLFSTTRGVFVLSNDRAVARLTDGPAVALAVHGDDVFLQLDGTGVVHTSLAAIDAAHLDQQPVVATAPLALPEPELTSPPTRSAFVPPTGPNDFKDIRLAVGMGFGGSFSSGMSTGPLTSAFALHLDRVWSSDLPGFVWSIGLDLDRADGDIAHTGATLDNMAAHVGLAYGFVIADNVQIELGPVVEVDGAALDEPFSSSTAWGNGWGVGGALAIHYTLISGLEVGGRAGYTVRWFSLSGDCTPCATPSFSADVTTSSASVALSIGRRY